ncbi:beta-phosphoglucomutase [Bacillus sp. JJ722]|uniref:beta-phosphoglucomutase n=1 Tax=Bacillus sp. JJ722 TaxID=3122973 RepID=UPI002FFD8A78
MKPKAFIFDLDGVLTDTAHLHFIAWKNISEKMGLKFCEEVNEQLKGVSRIRSLEIILEVNQCRESYTQKEIEAYATEKNNEYIRLIKQITPKDVLDGILDFINEAKDNGIKLAVASASKNALSVLQALDVEHYFDYIADANRIQYSKPHPEVFLDCCKNLGVEPEECIGFEDAQAGIEALKTAGIFSVGINVNVVTEKPDYVLQTTSELNYKKVIERYIENYSEEANNFI